LLNHSLERSLRLVTPVSGLFMVSPAAHTPYFCASFSYGTRCLPRHRAVRNVGGGAELLRL
jgi:hypothetical protein